MNASPTSNAIVEDKFTTGDHTVFVGKIVEAYADMGVFTDSYDVKKAHMVYHAGGNNFYTLRPKTLQTLSPSLLQEHFWTQMGICALTYRWVGSYWLKTAPLVSIDLQVPMITF